MVSGRGLKVRGREWIIYGFLALLDQIIKYHPSGPSGISMSLAVGCEVPLKKPEQKWTEGPFFHKILYVDMKDTKSLAFIKEEWKGFGPRWLNSQSIILIQTLYFKEG